MKLNLNLHDIDSTNPFNPLGNLNPFIRGYYLRKCVKPHKKLIPYYFRIYYSEEANFDTLEQLLFYCITANRKEDLKLIFKNYIKDFKNLEQTNFSVHYREIPPSSWYRLDETCDTYKKFINKYPEILI